jgi:hypothetical protein
MPQATVQATVKIDVSPEGIKFTIEGLDADLASLIGVAGKFSVLVPEYHTFDTSTVVIKSDKVIAFVDPPEEPEIPVG